MKGETMGERLKRLREARGMSQPQLAEAARIPVGTLRQWEQDRRLPSLEGFFAVADGLGVTLDELAGRTAPEPKHKRKGKWTMADEKKGKGLCALCGGPYANGGQNPWPRIDDVNARVCECCEGAEVLPARMRYYAAKWQMRPATERPPCGNWRTPTRRQGKGKEWTSGRSGRGQHPGRPERVRRGQVRTLANGPVKKPPRKKRDEWATPKMNYWGGFEN
jgi:DNA-binding XRE family transcriptional regulator